MDVRFGSDRTPTREGTFSVGWKSRNHFSTLYNTPMPYAMFFSGGQAVHYSADFAARGYSGASHGCVNVRNYSGDQVALQPGAGRRQGDRLPLIASDRSLAARAGVRCRPSARAKRDTDLRWPAREAYRLQTVARPNARSCQGQERAVRTSGPSAVIATVCSAWAPRDPSRLRRVQPSGSV